MTTPSIDRSDTALGRSSELHIDNPQLVAVLGAAGITAVDIELFRSLSEKGFSVYIHGSVAENRIRATSDIDFSVIGNFSNLPLDVRDTIMPGLGRASETDRVDYVSTSMRSQNGRKLSLHISEPQFRHDYPTIERPFATEYRPALHKKIGTRSYVLAAADKSGHVHLMDIMCSGNQFEDGAALTQTPQTGLFPILGAAIIDGEKPHETMTVRHLLRIQPNGDVVEDPHVSSEEPYEVMSLGLEYDKMQSDTPLFPDHEKDTENVRQPMARSMDAVAEFTSTEPSVITSRMMDGLAQHWYKFKPNKPR